MDRKLLAVLTALVLAAGRQGPALAGSGAEPSPADLPGQAAQLAKVKPGVQRQIGLAEVLRSAGRSAEAMRELDQALKLKDAAAARARLGELICWRMMPVPQPKLQEFRRAVGDLADRGAASAWLGVYRLYLAAMDQDRAALLSAAKALPAPLAITGFPGTSAEKAHYDLLIEMGLSRTRAGLEVVTHRSFGELYALRDLDRAVTREIDAARADARAADTQTLQAARDGLRKTYLSASRNLVERLFALQLNGQSKQRDELLARAAKVTWLADHAALTKASEGLDEPQAWTLVVQPMLGGDLRLIDSPPDLASIPRKTTATLSIHSDRKLQQGDIASYEGSVRIELEHLTIRCDKASVVSGPKGADALLVGSGHVVVRGVPGRGEISADRFTFNSELGGFTLAGSVRMSTPAAELAAEQVTIKLRACTVTATGEVRDRKSLLDDFAAAGTVPRKLDLLAKITAVYDDAELPSEVRYLLALDLLRGHMTWHAPPKDTRREEVARILQKEYWPGNDPWRWRDAHTGEPWMRQPPATAPAPEDAGGQAGKLGDGEDIAAAPLYWRLTDPGHADVLRARKLLEGMRGPELSAKAQHWVAEIARNNTVLTFDVPGGYARGADGPVVMDARNADAVSFRLYRVRKADDLLAVTDRIGEDFIYRDYELQSGQPPGHPPMMERLHHAMTLKLQRAAEARRAPPAFGAGDLVGQWDVRVADLEAAAIDRWAWRDLDWYEDWGDEGESAYFDDACRRHRDRLRKRYRSQGPRPRSAWACDRVVWIPGKHLSQPGAYVLVAQSNGQKAYAPVVVEPLSMTMRRCRDGVFAMVSDAEGDKPVAGASIHGTDMVGEALTDAQGAAFARIFAAGDRAIVAEKDGRYAVGGFGRVFEGVYVSQQELARHDRGDRYLRKLRDRMIVSRSAQVYAGGHVVAAYTDRPTYRPGQKVLFKIIVRHMPQAHSPAGQGAATGGFRAEDFEIASNLELPPEGTKVRYELISPRMRSIGGGALGLNDYGTAAGEAQLLSEAATGTYSLQLNIDGRTYVVPDVFAVKYYRRPNFLLKVAGVPKKITQPGPVALTLTGRYYFGKAMAGGKVEARLVRPDQAEPFTEAKATLDAAGQAQVNLRIPPGLKAGDYFVICTLTDQTQRIVSASQPCRIELPGQAGAQSSLSGLPRFIAQDEAFTVKTGAKQVVATPGRLDEIGRHGAFGTTTFDVRDGVARITMHVCGWYTLTAGEDHKEVFFYGGTQPPHLAGGKREKAAVQRQKVARSADEPRELRPRWIDLTHYADDEEDEDALVDADADAAYDDAGRWDRRWDRKEYRLLALFDRQHAQVGGKLRVLVYVPFERARLVFTVEGHTVVDYVVVNPPPRKDCRYHVVEIPVQERYRPNFYLRGRILWGKGEILQERAPDRLLQAREVQKLEELAGDDSDDPRWCRVDVLAAGAAEAGEKLKVSLDTDRRQYRPGQGVNVIMRVTDLAGAARQAEVSLGAVDESVYSFGEDAVGLLAGAFADPRPQRRYLDKTWRSFLGSRWSAGRLRALAQARLAQLAQAQQELAKAMDSLRQSTLMEERVSLAAEAAAQRARAAARPRPLADFGEMPATSLSLARLRTDFRETAAWLPQLRTGPDGLVRTTFRLPDSLTSYRLTAVALTRKTEIGTARTAIRVRQPLSVQVFLPRFAVETDRLLAVALIHNDAKRPRECDASWEVSGATVREPADGARSWKTQAGDGKKIVFGRVLVPASGTARVGLWLAASAPGTATVAFRAADGGDTDAEQRVLPIQALGRPREVVMSGSFARRHEIVLPAGFRAEDLAVTLARANAAQAMDGLGYLVDYPYGCVEQTMSRFLPAVMVKHAVREAAAALPPEVQQRLPDVLAKGLARLYNFQHDDGGWGWWEKDKTNDAMTVYVLYGLARCRLAGTQVDADVLRRGCEYLRKRLGASGGQGALAPELEARAWLVLALAGEADANALAKRAAEALRAGPSEEARCDLALACHNAALSELAERLWAGLRNWQPTLTAAIALKLTAQVAFGAPLDGCRDTAARLLALREGHRWGSTRDTSWAVEALAEMVRYAGRGAPAKSVRVTVAGKTVLEIKDPDELSKLVYRVRIGAEALGRREAAEIVMSVQADEPVSYAVTAAGTQRLDKVEPLGQDVRITRQYTTLDGAPIDGAVKPGEVFAARLAVELRKGQDYFIIEDRRPAGCEFAEERVFGRDADSAAHVEFRDDRVCVFHTRLAAGQHEIVYYLRAETSGTHHVLPGCAYPMYDEKTRGETGAAAVEVSP